MQISLFHSYILKHTLIENIHVSPSPFLSSSSSQIYQKEKKKKNPSPQGTMSLGLFKKCQAKGFLMR